MIRLSDRQVQHRMSIAPSASSARELNIRQHIIYVLLMFITDMILSSEIRFRLTDNRIILLFAYCVNRQFKFSHFCSQEYEKDGPEAVLFAEKTEMN